MEGEMENDRIEDMEMEVISSMWPEDIGNNAGKQFNVEKPGGGQDMFEEVTIVEEPSIVDFKRLLELTDYTDRGSSQLAYLVKHWEYKQANAVRLLREELDNLSRQRQEVELKKLEILEEHRFEDERYVGDKRPVSILDEIYDIWPEVPQRKKEFFVKNKRVEVDAEYGTAVYWKHRALNLERLLEASVLREQILMEKLQEGIKNLEKQSSPVEELSQILKRADNFLHFVLQNAPVVIGHQDKDLRYRFIYNHFPSLQEEDILGKTDVEIFTGAGVQESQEFKREVLEKGLPAKREITFETDLFGFKTFLIYVEPVFSKAGETIGINYMGMEVTDQVRKREKMVKLREEIAVQKAKETELNKTIHITEETMRAKQMLATMSHEIRSPLSGVVSMAEILSTTKLDREQRQLLNVMISSGDLILQLINDILDLSKVESGVMKLEQTKFRPREVVKHVLQTAAASLQKILTLEGHVADDVPIEVIGEVLRIRQILTNLISNAVKFTHKGKVGIKLYVTPDPGFTHEDGCQKENRHIESTDDIKEQAHFSETIVWIRCDVYDSGIGIPENALPTLFKRYMQVSADHARKYGGTGLGLAICKQLVELMGGRLTVSSRVNCGSTFTFILPYKVSAMDDHSDDADELSNMSGHDALTDESTTGFFQFHPRTLGSLFSPNGPNRTQRLHSVEYSGSTKFILEDLYSFTSNSSGTEQAAAARDPSSIIDVGEKFSELESPSSQSTNSSTETPLSRERLSHDDEYHFYINASFTDEAEEKKKPSEMENVGEPRGTSQRRERDSICNGCSKSSPEIPKLPARPKILLVEDNTINVMVTQSMMKQLGHSVDVVNNGVEAIRALQRCKYDLILMDVCMPVMDGLQATRIIRSFEETGNWDAAVEAGIELAVPSEASRQSDESSWPSRQGIPIIALTANALSESSDECFANGMDAFISKPITLRKLKQCIEQYLP